MKRVTRLLAVSASALALAACSTPEAPRTDRVSAESASSVATASVSPPPSVPPRSTPPTATPTATPTAVAGAPASTYRSEVIHRGVDHPDDLVLDASGALLYSDYTNGTISRLGGDGSVTVLHRGIDGPEGMVLLGDGTLVVAEENTNRLLAFAPGRSRPAVVTTLPGTPRKVTCHQGVDGIAWDARTLSLIVPDPVTGTIYRMAPDGTSRTVVARGFVHPVGAAVDAGGHVYIADECGGNVWRVSAGGTRDRVARPTMPDDVAIDADGNLLVTDVRHVNHDVRRWPRDGGRSTVLARRGLVEPQGLLVDPSGRIVVADDQARVILRLAPTS
jgi:sugar lactone lactonase YvrE